MYCQKQSKIKTYKYEPYNNNNKEKNLENNKQANKQTNKQTKTKKK